MLTRWLVLLLAGGAAVVVLGRTDPAAPPTRPGAAASAAPGRPLLPDNLPAKAAAPARGSRAGGAKAAVAPAKLADAGDLVAHALFITDLRVVNDARASAGGKWSFGYLMRAVANTRATGIHPEELVRRWLRHWEDDQVVNGFTVGRREDIRAVIDGWPKLTDGRLDLDRAPFRLLAIVNRLDLRNNLVLGVPRIGGGGAGEGRFVFGLVNAQGAPRNFTVIFEYEVKRRSFDEVRQWARRWYDLKGHPLGSREYLEALEKITDEFAGPAADPERPPAGSALAQLRTNENALSRGWELREFRPDVGGTGYLRQVPVKQTPDVSFEHTQALLDYLTRDRDAILQKRHAVPVEFPAGTPFLAGSSLLRVNFRWTLPDGAPPEAEEARKRFAVSTCNGCHGAETDTQFLHVVPRPADEPARLSRFLTEPQTGDLAERAKDLKALVETGRPYEERRLPLQFVH